MPKLPPKSGSTRAEDPAPHIAPPHPQGPTAAITRRASDRIRAGHLWVYRSDVETLAPALDSPDIPPGSLITVTDNRGIPLGTGLYSTASQIAIRIVSHQPGLSRGLYLDQLRDRVHVALDLRAALSPDSPSNNAHRLIFSEADLLPGIVADLYNDLILLQLLTQATAQDDVRHLLTALLRDRLHPATIVERPDPKVRELEQLPLPPPEPLFSASKTPQITTQFTINNVHFHHNAAAGQKTGAFLDQRLNYAAAASYASGRALDVCTYQGGFALHLAQHCQQVTGVDTSRSALETADRNLALNLQLQAQVQWIEADAFDLLREYSDSHELFDTIVLDPPAFAKTHRAKEGALRGYKELNLRAIKMLQPGGILITCSCSHHVPLQDFTAIVAAAASDAGRHVQVLEIRGAAPDHPAILTLPETTYLKCLICHVQ
jgi:23S rRNA (cytosine1962-C5)-methyltransferase